MLQSAPSLYSDGESAVSFLGCSGASVLGLPLLMVSFSFFSFLGFWFVFIFLLFCEVHLRAGEATQIYLFFYQRFFEVAAHFLFGLLCSADGTFYIFRHNTFDFNGLFSVVNLQLVFIINPYESKKTTYEVASLRPCL